jgi:hypothetical protein
MLTRFTQKVIGIRVHLTVRWDRLDGNSSEWPVDVFRRRKSRLKWGKNRSIEGIMV